MKRGRNRRRTKEIRKMTREDEKGEKKEKGERKGKTVSRREEDSKRGVERE